jgi:peptidylprolyl isomerase
MITAKKGDTVRVHYTGTLTDGSVFDSSEGRDPLEFTLGSQMVIPGFENAVLGMQVGDSVSVTIPPEEAYGPHRAENVIELNRSQVPAHIQPEIGMTLQLGTPDGQAIEVVITDLTETTLTLDGNHHLAGEALTFALDLVEIV